MMVMIMIMIINISINDFKVINLILTILNGAFRALDFKANEKAGHKIYGPLQGH
ncbi:hypothetical protein ID849_09390 [Xenorhabdus sp. 3]|uniref:hypothetical protein n=1 Tax=Xenorhabdus doucetiae TaxID=351671 RepID=UPI001984635F|nr:hypothetical protein [Xenorhabdus sp. 3]MBD2784885.1 hypothetical protein [Xenorhabdus sp. 3]